MTAIQPTLLDTVEGPMPTGIVYLMSDGYKFKFGYTRDIKRRSGELRAFVIFHHPGSLLNEKSFIKRFSHWSLGGEWFSLPTTGADLTALRKLVYWGGGAVALQKLDLIIANNLRGGWRDAA